MTIEAKIIADSVGPTGVRITTMQLRYPRFIHAELMTHRVFSRNASSSRAIPVHRMIEELKRDPAMPVFWGSNKPGMQAGDELQDEDLEQVQKDWIIARDYAIEFAQKLIEAGLHKQIANRILEPWAHINVVVTATEWNNFWSLRCHKDAQPEMRALAEAMREIYVTSLPIELQPGEWHLPYINAQDWSNARFLRKKNCITRDEPMYDELAEKVLIGVSIARCARVSYLTHDGKETTVEEDLALYERLVGSVPLHASPAEHQATPDIELGGGFHKGGAPFRQWQNAHQHGNFTGWIQYRKTIEGKVI